MKANSIILLFCLCWTLVISRNKHKGDGEHKTASDDHDTELETKWHKFGVDISKVHIPPNKCRNNRYMGCDFLKMIGYCSLNFFVMQNSCPVTCRFCAPPQKTKIKRPPKCEDDKWECPVWAHNGDCLRFPQYMKKYCKLSCMLCGKDKDGKLQFDEDTLCPSWASVGYCKENEEVKEKCKHSCYVYKDVKQDGLDPDYENAFYHYPFYIYYPYTTLKKRLATVPPTEHPPSVKPVTPTLPPNYSTLPPTPAITTPKPGEKLPTPTEGKPESSKPTHKPTKAPSHATPATHTEAPATEAPQPTQKPLPETPPQPQPTLQPAQPTPQPVQPTPQPPQSLPQTQPPQPFPQAQPPQPLPQSQPAQPLPQSQPTQPLPQSQPTQPLPQPQPTQGTSPQLGGGNQGNGRGAVKRRHHHHYRHFKKMHKRHHKSHFKHHKNHSHKRMHVALRKHRKHH